VQVTTGYLDYLDAIEAEHASRCLHNRVAVRKVDACARLSRTVKTPAPNYAFLIDGERVEAPRADSNCAPPTGPENNTLRSCAVDLTPLENFTAKLALLARTPGKNYASSGQYEQVVVSGRNIDASLIRKCGSWDEFVCQAC
jgi:hypothetical protein